MHDIRKWINEIPKILDSHNLGSPGAYRRWNWQPPGSERPLSLNPYGCADAANILYTIGKFPSSPTDRAAWISALQSMQCPETGMFHEATHHEIHTTAHCIAAMELFDAQPEHPLQQLHHLRKPDAMIAFLESLDWKGRPWSESHRGAGLYAALTLTHGVDWKWKDRYFSWIHENTDPETGFLRKSCISRLEMGTTDSIFPHLAGTFHYLFNSESERRPLRYPCAMIDTCLTLFEDRSYPIGNNIGFAEIDWVYCLTRSLRQSGHRFDEVRSALLQFTDRYIPFLLKLNVETDEGLNDLHRLFGSICCLAELQTALPGHIATDAPLKLVLDRRPFI